MSQAVLKNEVSDLTPRTGVNLSKRREIAKHLGTILADAVKLRFNTQGLHWNVEGPMFYSIHKLTEEQYRSIGESIDVLAERIRALGAPAPESFSEFQSLSDIEDLPSAAPLNQRVERLVRDYESAVVRMSWLVQAAEKYGDVKTADILTERIGAYEEYAWMLRATIAKS